MQQRITFNSYLTKILMVSVLFITLPMAFSFAGNLPTAASYLESFSCFFIMTILSVRILLGPKYVRFYTIAFIVQTIIGLAHYLLLVDPSYFSSTGDPVSTFWREYLAVYDSVERLVEDRHSFGLLYFDSGSWQVTHPEIWKIISWPITFLGVKWLNYAPLNLYSILMASANVMVWYNHKYPGLKGDKNGARKYLLFFSAYFPQFILNDTVWREPFGLAIISIGIVLLSLSNNLLTKGISFIVLGFFSFIQRTVYLVIAGATLALGEMTIKKKAAKIFLIPIFAILFFYLVQFFDTQVSEDYTSGYVNSMSIMALPIKIIFGMIGPFPWTQFFIVTKFNAAAFYQLQDYLTGVFQIGYLIAILSNIKSFSFRNLDYMTIMGFGIALAGFMTRMMHIGYISEGIFFTLPWFFSQIGEKYRKYLLISFISLLLLNVVVTFLGTSGLTNFYR